MIDKQIENGLVKDLETLGLGAKEASIYIALLQLGLVGSSKIISATGLHGQFVYQGIAILEEKGLVQHVIQNGRKKFSAKPPSTLLNLIEQQHRTAESVAEQLQKLLVLPQPQQLEVFQGRDSYVAHELDLLARAPQDAELLVVGGLGDKFHPTMGEHVRAYDVAVTKKHIRIRYIGCEAQRGEIEKIARSRADFVYRLLPGEFGGEVNTNIWPDCISFNIFGTPVSKITLSNKSVAESYKQFFETLWKMGK